MSRIRILCSLMKMAASGPRVPVRIFIYERVQARPQMELTCHSKGTSTRGTLEGLLEEVRSLVVNILHRWKPQRTLLLQWVTLLLRVMMLLREVPRVQI
jgi:hypothetical protein